MHRLQDSRTDRPVSLPAVGRLLNEPAYAELVTVYGHHRVVEAIREQIATERDGVADGSARHAAVAARLAAGVAPNSRRGINVTGVIPPTKPGRPPLSHAALDAVTAGAGYRSLQLALDPGERGAPE